MFNGVSQEREFCSNPSEKVQDVVYCSLLEVAREIKLRTTLIKNGNMQNKNNEIYIRVEVRSF